MKKYRIFTIFIFIAVLSFIPANKTEASSNFKYKDYTLNKTIKYDGVSPVFYYDGTTYSLSETPAIITEGNISLVSASYLFRDILGAECSYSSSKQRITVKYNNHVLKMYINSTSAILDGEEVTCPIAPVRVKYSASKIKTTLVPTRFVAESLGIKYSWDSSTSTATIKKPLLITINGKTEEYTGTQGKIEINGNSVNTKGTPSIVISDNTMLCVRKSLLEASGIQFSHNETTGEITLSYGDNIINCCVGSCITYVNNILKVCPVEPSIVTFEDSGDNYLYIPGRYVFENLGFEYNWIEQGTYSEILSPQEMPVYGSEAEYFRIINPDEGYKYSVDTEYCGQYFEIPLPEEITVDDIIISDDYMSGVYRLIFPGNLTEIFAEEEFLNTGDCILQIRIYYDEEKDTTEMCFCSSVILDCELSESDIPGYASLYIDYTGNINKKIIVIDAGHGAHDPGAVYFGVNESDINLKMLLYCKQYFDESGIKVYYTRTDDTFYSLDERAALSGLVGADMFISIHHNASNNKSTTGTSVYYSNLDTYESLNGLTSSALAEQIYPALVNTLKTKEAGIIAKDFVVVRDSAAPAVLLEIGFMSNKDELDRLTDNSFSKKAAKTIYKTVKSIYKLFK